MKLLLEVRADTLNGLKENVIVGHLIPAGTGMREFGILSLEIKEEYDQLMAAKKAYESSKKKNYKI